MLPPFHQVTSILEMAFPTQKTSSLLINPDSPVVVPVRESWIHPVREGLVLGDG